MSTIPSAAQVRAALGELTHSQVQELARRSGVPFTTLWKIRDGTTFKPGLDTVRAFFQHLKRVARLVA